MQCGRSGCFVRIYRRRRSGRLCISLSVRLVSLLVTVRALAFGLHPSAGYTVQAIVALGISASKGLPRPFLGQPPAPAAATINVIAVVAGTFLWLLSFWFFALSTVAVIQGFRKMKVNVTLWAFTFPNAGLVLATIQLGKAYNSPAINYLTSVMTVALFAGWLIVGLLLLNAGRKGRLP